MIVPFSSSGFVARFGSNNFTNLLQQEGDANSDSSRIGSTPQNSEKSAEKSSELGRTKNPSYNSFKSVDPSNITYTGREVQYSDDKGGNTTEALPRSNEEAHYNPQWVGTTIRTPMHSNKPGPNSGPVSGSKTIFFTFKGGQSTPSIYLYINPSQLTISHSKRIQEQITRGGFVLFHWGDNLDEISASGFCGSFARNSNRGKNGIGNYTGRDTPDNGLDRRDTWPYYRFMQLLALYRNNGIGSYTTGTGEIESGGLLNTAKAIPSASSLQKSSSPYINKTGIDNFYRTASAKSAIASISNSGGSEPTTKADAPYFCPIEMHYDDNIFSGYFDRFVWTERAEQPFTFNFDFTFKVLNTQYNSIFQDAYSYIKPKDASFDDALLANFRYNSL